MPISPTLPTDGQSDWDVPLNAALDVIVDGVNANETAIAAKLDSSAAPELIRDTMGTALVAGTNVTITPNDGSDTITIAASGGGGPTALDDLTDVDAATPADGDVLTFDTGTSEWVAAAPTGGTPADASTTVKGIVELATSAETTTGTDTVRATTPAGVKAVADTLAPLSHTHAATDIASGTVATARLGSGTANSTSFLRGDQTWAVPSGGGTTVGASVYLTSNLTNTTGSRDVAFNATEVVDAGFSWNGSTFKITVTDAGWYALYANVRLVTTVSTAMAVVLTANGASCVRSSLSTYNTANDIAASGVAYLAAGTEVATSFFSTAGTQIAGEAAPSRTHFRIVKL